MFVEPLLNVKNLKVYFGVAGKGLFGKKRTFVKAVDDVSFSIDKGETFALVGESGSGKTTLGHAILCAVGNYCRNSSPYSNVRGGGTDHSLYLPNPG